MSTGRRRLSLLVFRLLAWALLLFMAYATLGPIDLRPRAPGVAVSVERLAAYIALGAMFTFAYPKHWWAGLLATFACAIPMELAQHLVAGRHGRWLDLWTKVAGGMTGTAAGLLVMAFLGTRQGEVSRNPPDAT